MDTSTKKATAFKPIVKYLLIYKDRDGKDATKTADTAAAARSTYDMLLDFVGEVMIVKQVTRRCERTEINARPRKTPPVASGTGTTAATPAKTKAGAK